MAATAKAAKNAASAPNPANRCTPDRRKFALTGPSTALDHRTHAARRDLADVTLAGRWFAPHYAEAETRSCGLAGADIYSSDVRGTRISQLLPGERFAVLEESGDWLWGYSEHDGYVGYVRTDTLGETAKPTHIVVARSALIFREPSNRAEVAAVLPTGSRISGAVEDQFLHTNDGYVALQQLGSVDGTEPDPVAVAERLNGMPYLWGGRGIGGIDCSGLVQVAFGLAGVALPRDSDQQIAEGSEIDALLQRGDLLFYPDHVTLMTAPDQAIHASGHWMSTVIEPLEAIVARLGAPIARRRVAP
ncbi:C40 family peptidase [Sphingomonas tabacisoli]|uniref:C40 family peptidase n=1 Tax=Sphingomonas tabacisoli TaxID=2249466 RepID=A0ABW4I491_9SPHN